MLDFKLKLIKKSFEKSTPEWNVYKALNLETQNLQTNFLKIVNDQITNKKDFTMADQYQIFKNKEVYKT